MQADGTAVVGVDDNWCQAAADRIERAGKQRRARLGAPAAARRHLCRGRADHAAPPAAPRARSRSSAASARCAALHNAQNAACAAAAALALGLDAAAIQDGLALVSRPRAPHGAGRPQGRGAVRQRLQGDQRGFRGAGAGLLQRHLLDRRRQAEDRRHHVARRLLPAHPQGLSDRRGGGRIRRARSTARSPTRSPARSTARSRRRPRCRGVGR